MSNKTIAVVTGGAGFIGSHMVDLLIASGYGVRVIDNFSGGHYKNIEHLKDHSDLEVIETDICDLRAESAACRGAKYIFHFAGIGDIVPSIEKPLDYMQTNVQGTVRMLECARAAAVEKFVYAASSSCYGLAAVPTKESDPILPQYPYALSKYMGEQAAFHWQQVYQLPVNAIRIFNAYGERVRTTGAYGAVFGVFLKQKLAGKPFTVVGDGKQSRDFLYVTDVVRAFLKAAETTLTNQIWNLGAGQPQTINKLVELIGGEVDYIPKRPGEPDCTWADISKIKRDLNWQPCISFEAGVGRMLADIESWQEAPLWDSVSIAKATEKWFEYVSLNKEVEA